MKNQVKNLQDYSAAELRKLKVADLKELAQTLDIAIVNDDKSDRIKLHLQEDILSAHRKVRTRSRTPQIEITPQMQEVIGNEETSKSDKIRTLHDLGMSTTQIATTTNAHYSFAHQVVTKYKYTKSVVMDDAQTKDAVEVEVVETQAQVTDKKSKSAKK